MAKSKASETLSKIQEISTACLSLMSKLAGNKLAKGVSLALKKAEPALEQHRRAIMKSMAAKSVDPNDIKKLCFLAVSTMTFHMEHIKTAQRLLA